MQGQDGVHGFGHAGVEFRAVRGTAGLSDELFGEARAGGRVAPAAVRARQIPQHIGSFERIGLGMFIDDHGASLGGSIQSLVAVSDVVRSLMTMCGSAIEGHPRSGPPPLEPTVAYAGSPPQ